MVRLWLALGGDEIQMAFAGGAVEAERSARSGSLAEAPAALVGESGSWLGSSARSMARRPVSRQGLHAISMVIQPSTTAAIAITAVTTAPIAMKLLSSSARTAADLVVWWMQWSVHGTGAGCGNCEPVTEGQRGPLLWVPAWQCGAQRLDWMRPGSAAPRRIPVVLSYYQLENETGPCHANQIKVPQHAYQPSPMAQLNPFPFLAPPPPYAASQGITIRAGSQGIVGVRIFFYLN